VYNHKKATKKEEEKTRKENETKHLHDNYRLYSLGVTKMSNSSVCQTID